MTGPPASRGGAAAVAQPRVHGLDGRVTDQSGQLPSARANKGQGDQCAGCAGDDRDEHAEPGPEQQARRERERGPGEGEDGDDGVGRQKRGGSQGPAERDQSRSWTAVGSGTSRASATRITTAAASETTRRRGSCCAVAITPSATVRKVRGVGPATILQRTGTGGHRARCRRRKRPPEVTDRPLRRRQPSFSLMVKARACRRAGRLPQ
jgi:hypothetical protein